jgi:hypothetical protein
MGFLGLIGLVLGNPASYAFFSFSAYSSFFGAHESSAEQRRCSRPPPLTLFPSTTSSRVGG